MNEKIYIQLRITGEKLDFDEIAHCTGISPCHIHRKGEIIRNNFFENLCSEDCWLVQQELPNIQNINEGIGDLIGSANKNFERFIAISKKSHVQLWLSIYPENLQTSIQISSKNLEIVSKLGIDLGVVITNI